MNEAEISDTQWHMLQDELHHHFHTVNQGQCLLWVDPAQADPFEANSLVEDLRVRVPIRHPRFDPLRAPYLVPLDLSRSADADVFRESVEMAWQAWDTELLNIKHGQPICAWVRAGTGITALAAHWARNCHLHIWPKKTKLLRFQDPGVREWLWPALSEIQQRAMLGPVVEIYAIGRQRSLIQHCCAGRNTMLSSQQGDYQRNYPALHLNEDQWTQIEDYAILHAAWLNWRNSPNGSASIPLGPEWQRPILAALTQATRLGLRDDSDRELFALHALQLGAGFYQRSQLQEVWSKTQAGEFYGAALEDVTGRSADQLGVFLQRFDGYSDEGRHG
jgi:hypothetical protein